MIKSVIKSPTAELAAFAARLDYGDLPEAVIDRAKHCIIDALGCCIFGVTLPWTQKLISFIVEEGGRPRAVIPGTSLRTNVSQAVLVSATAGHGFELDDMHTAAHLHAGSLAIPTALAVAEAEGHTSGQDLIAAIVAGYEVGIHVGLAAPGQLSSRGHHAPGLLGTFVCAATAARLLKLDEETTRQAFGIAGSLGAGLAAAAREGAMSKRFHAGRAAQAGVYGAYLAQRGFTGIPNILEAPHGGFHSTFSSEADLSRCTAGLGEVWEILNVGFKPYATAAGTHPVLLAIDILMREHALQAKDIQELAIHCSTKAYNHCVWPYKPTGVTAAQMNMQFTSAMMIIDRAAMVEQFREERLADPAALAMLERIRVQIDPAYDGRGNDDHRHAARVIIRTIDGKRLEHEILVRPGSPPSPMSPEAFAAKFETLAGRVFPMERVRALFDCVEKLESLGSKDLIALVGA